MVLGIRFLFLCQSNPPIGSPKWDKRLNKDHFLYSTENQAVVGKFKDEANGKIITEFVCQAYVRNFADGSYGCVRYINE